MRDWLSHVVREWSSVRMLTLTVDPKLYASSRVAYESVRRRRCIPILMRELGVSRWVSVLEIQPGTGFPHWHVVCEAGRLDYRKMHSIWGPSGRFGVGNADGDRGHLGLSPSRAVRYLSKYLFKAPSGGFPDWVLSMKRLREVDSAKSVMTLTAFRQWRSFQRRESVSCPLASSEAGDVVIGRSGLRVHRVLADRVASCCVRSYAVLDGSPVGAASGVPLSLRSVVRLARLWGLRCVPLRRARDFPVLEFDEDRGWVPARDRGGFLISNRVYLGGYESVHLSGSDWLLFQRYLGWRGRSSSVVPSLCGSDGTSLATGKPTWATAAAAEFRSCSPAVVACIGSREATTAGEHPPELSAPPPPPSGPHVGFPVASDVPERVDRLGLAG